MKLEARLQPTVSVTYQKETRDHVPSGRSRALSMTSLYGKGEGVPRALSAISAMLMASWKSSHLSIYSCFLKIMTLTSLKKFPVTNMRILNFDKISTICFWTSSQVTSGNNRFSISAMYTPTM